MNILARSAFGLVVLLLLAACAGTGGGLGSIAKTTELRPGMSGSEVRDLLGAPLQTQFVGSKWVWKYTLHEYFKGYVPFYLAFDKDTQRLNSWYADEAEYHRQQSLWIRSLEAQEATRRKN